MQEPFSCFSTTIDFSGFKLCPPKSNNDHRLQTKIIWTKELQVTVQT